MPIESEAVVFPAPGSAEVRRVLLPDPGAREVGVRTVYSGVSLGTERGCYLGTYNRMGQRQSEAYPFATGYQKSGIVDRVGLEVSGLKVGDRVLLSRTRLLDADLERRSWLGHTGYSVMPEDQVWRLPDAADLEEASLFVMVGVGSHGNRLANVQAGDLVGMIGQGMIGQMSAQFARHRGARVLACDLIEKRVQASCRYSADVTIDAGGDRLAALVKAERPEGADVVTETTGKAGLFPTCVDLVRREGKIIMQGYYPEPIVVDFHPTHAKRAAVFFPCAWDDSGEVARALGGGWLAVKPLITHRLSYRQAPEAYRMIAESPNEIISMVFRWDHD